MLLCLNPSANERVIGAHDRSAWCCFHDMCMRLFHHCSGLSQRCQTFISLNSQLFDKNRQIGIFLNKIDRKTIPESLPQQSGHHQVQISAAAALITDTFCHLYRNLIHPGTSYSSRSLDPSLYPGVPSCWQEKWKKYGTIPCLFPFLPVGTDCPEHE